MCSSDLIMLFSTVFDYTNARLIGHFQDTGKHKAAKAVLIVDIVGNLGILGFFKYTDFAIDNINSLLHAGIPAAELRQKLFRKAEPAEADALLGVFLAEGRLTNTAGRYALAGFSVRLTKRQTAIREELLRRFLQGGMEPEPIEAVLAVVPPPERETARQVLESLLTGGELVRLSPELCWHREVFQKGLDILRTLCADHSAVTLAEVRDALGTTRKYALLFLEACDRRQITVREGDCRRLNTEFHD